MENNDYSYLCDYDKKFKDDSTIIKSEMNVGQLKSLLRSLGEVVLDKAYINIHVLKIRRIYIMRLITGMGLLEAKKFIEDIF